MCVQVEDFFTLDNILIEISQHVSTQVLMVWKCTYKCDDPWMMVVIAVQTIP